MRYERFPLITHEGVALAVNQSLRLWTWLQISALFPIFNFTAVLFSFMHRAFPRHRSTLHAGLLSLEYFPAAAQEGKRYAQKMLRSLLPGRSGKTADPRGMKSLVSAMVESIRSGVVGERRAVTGN